MRWNKPYRRSLILLLICLCIHLYSLDSQRVEHYYALGFYQRFSSFLRQIYAWVPFSLGDILYAIAALYIISRFIKYGRKMTSREMRSGWRKQTRSKLLKIFNILACLYIFFNLFWGINYSRQGIADQLDLQPGKYSKQELLAVNTILLQQVNGAKQELIQQRYVYPGKKSIFRQVSKAYDKASLKYSFLTYKHPAVKSSLWGWMGNYLGFTGYYNPFTGEAQVNTTVPVFTQPFTAAHEVAHQIGYAKEMEANFVGFLAIAESGDPALLYSGYLEAFLYANRNLYRTDTTAAIAVSKQLLPEIKNDIETLRAFANAHRNPIEPIIRWGYGVFLRSNQQPSGILSYSEVTAFIIAYYKKTGKIP